MEERIAPVDFSYSFHQTDEFVHSAGIKSWQRQIENRLDESISNTTIDGKQLWIVCFIEIADMPLVRAVRIGELSRLGFSPLQAYVCAKGNIDPVQITAPTDRNPQGRKLENTLEYKRALIQYKDTTNPDTTQEIATLTKLYDSYQGRIILDVEGNTPDVIQDYQEDLEGGESLFKLITGPYFLLSEGQWESGMQKYQKGLQTMTMEITKRERMLKGRLIQIAQDERVYAIVIRIGSGHVNLEHEIHEAGIKTTSEVDVDLFGGREYPDTSFDLMVKKIVALNGDISQISELDWWKSLIAEHIRLIEMSLENQNPSRDVLGKYIEIINRGINTVDQVFQNMEDVHMWQLHMEQAIENGTDFLTAHNEFISGHIKTNQ